MREILENIHPNKLSTDINFCVRRKDGKAVTKEDLPNMKGIENACFGVATYIPVPIQKEDGAIVIAMEMLKFPVNNAVAVGISNPPGSAPCLSIHFEVHDIERDAFSLDNIYSVEILRGLEEFEPYAILSRSLSNGALTFVTKENCPDVFKAERQNYEQRISELMVKYPNAYANDNGDLVFTDEDLSNDRHYRSVDLTLCKEPKSDPFAMQDKEPKVGQTAYGYMCDDDPYGGPLPS